MTSYLLRSSLQPSSIPTYRRAWALFYKFYNSVFHLPFAFLPISPSLMALFIGYMFHFHYAPSTVTKYISALGYSHKLLGFPDPSKVFYVSQILKGYKKVGFRLDSRLPITLPILDRLVSIAPFLQGSTYQISQFQAMCSLAFYAFLRIGEMTVHFNGNANPPLQLHQITKLISPSGELQAFKLTFGDFKHSYNSRPFSVVLSRQPNSTCPVLLLSKYLTLRGIRPGAIFVSEGGLPVSRSVFSSQLLRACHLCGLDPSRYKGHSFRIGAASYAADRGLSDAQIRMLGRWKSNAFLQYIRVPILNS